MPCYTMRTLAVLLLLRGVSCFLPGGVGVQVIGHRGSFASVRSASSGSFPEYVPADIAEIEEEVGELSDVLPVLACSCV